MPVEFDMPDELPKSDFLDEPGTYHVSIEDVNESPVNAKQMAIDGFQVSAVVLEGTPRVNNVCTEIGKHAKLTFFNPKPGSSEGADKWARARQAAFLIATELATKADLGKKGLQIDLTKAKGRQMIVGLERGQDPKFLQIAWANIWAVDDPDSAKFPKHLPSLKLIGKEPKPGAQATTPAGKSGNGAAKAATPAAPASQPSPQATAPAAQPVAAAATGDSWNL